MPGTVSAQFAIAQPRRIKATHRRRRKIAAGPIVQRYYDPQIGRFLSTDPAVAGFNLYNYANNNPYRFTDPDGRAPVGNTCSRAGVRISANGIVGKEPSNLRIIIALNKVTHRDFPAPTVRSLDAARPGDG